MDRFSASKLDVKSFAEEGATLQGEPPLRQFARLLAETDGRGASSPLAWGAKGEIRNPQHVNPEVWLHLHASATLPLACQRCMLPVDMPVAVERSFRFVPDEETAEAQDDESEEDLLALSRAFDLNGLIEDEMLMAMPIAPMHEACPEPVKLSAQDEDFEAASQERENPFAVLGKLKSGK